MLPFLSNLSINQKRYREVDMRIPAKRRRMTSVHPYNLKVVHPYNLKVTLDNLVSQHPPKSEIDLHFYYVPSASKVVAEFDLTFGFENRKLKKVTLKQRSTESATPCVECLVHDNLLELVSLYRNISNTRRLNCAFEFVSQAVTSGFAGRRDHEESLEEERLPQSYQRPKGEGGILLGAVVAVAAGLGLMIIELSDYAKFYDYKTAPFFMDMYVTKFLRMTRGFGQYEAAGFFDTEDPQQTLDLHRARFTTPINKLARQEIWSKGSYAQEKLEALAKTEFGSKSIRDIIIPFLKEADLRRPQNATDMTSLFGPWRYAMFNNGEPLKKLADAALDITKDDGLVDQLAVHKFNDAKKYLQLRKGVIYHERVELRKNGDQGLVPTKITEELAQEYFFSEK